MHNVVANLHQPPASPDPNRSNEAGSGSSEGGVGVGVGLEGGVGVGVGVGVGDEVVLSSSQSSQSFMKTSGTAAEKQEGPLRKCSAGNKDLAAIADGAFNFTFFNDIDAESCTFSR